MRFLIPLLLVLFVSTSVSAHEDEEDIESMTVFGRADQMIGEATSASEGRVGGADLSLRPMDRVGELLEAVPGLIATQHSGAGKSNAAQSTERISFIRAMFCIGSTGASMRCTPPSLATRSNSERNVAGSVSR